ncbi:MAG: AAA family ATPase [Spirulinaceae cyanobacterium]
MLTRLKVSGFKNLVDVDVRFGPFTCIAGANGVGKSNLFDSIKFLSNLATMPLTEAALSIRGKNSKFSDIRNLFHRVGDTYASRISFEAEIIVPQTSLDEFFVDREEAFTVYRYILHLAYQDHEIPILDNPLQVVFEKLSLLGKDEFKSAFDQKSEWYKSAIRVVSQEQRIFVYGVDSKSGHIFNDFSSQKYLSNLSPDEKPKSALNLHLYFPDATARTILSTIPQNLSSSAGTFNMSPAMWVRKEMQSWQNFHFEPSALRKPSKFSDPVQLGSDGSHLPKTLYGIAHKSEHPENVFCEISNKMMGFIEGARSVEIDQDKIEEWLTLALRYKDGTKLPAHQLSDGTLRLLALATLELDDNATGVYCIEEPENGFHPEFIRDVIQQLRDIAVDPQFPVEEGNSLRQVIINTHSPTVVRLVPDESLVIAGKTKARLNGEICTVVEFSCLDDTWRCAKGNRKENGMRSVYKGHLVPYLNPTPIGYESDKNNHQNGLDNGDHPEPRKVIERKDLHRYIPGFQDN